VIGSALTAGASTRDRARTPIGRVAAWSGLILLVFYLVFLGGGFAGIYGSGLRLISLVLIAGGLGVWAVVMGLRPAWRPRSRLLPAFALALASMTIATGLSRQPRLGLDYLAYAVLLVALYLLLVRILADPWFRGRFMGLTTLLAVVVGAWFLEACFVKWMDWWRLVGSFAAPPLRPEFESLTFGNPSAVLTMSVLLTLPAIAWLGVGSRRRAAAVLALLALSLSASLVTGSRAGWLAMAVGIVVAGAAWLAFSDHRALVASVIRARSVRIGLGMTALFAVAVGAVFLPGVLFRAGTGGEALRLSYVDLAIRMFETSPLVGTGLGTWVSQRIAFTPDEGSDYYIPHAHNVVAQTAAEQGVMGLIAGVIVAVMVLRLVVPALRDANRERRWMAWAALLGGVYFFAHNLLDFYPSFPPSLFAMAIPTAWLDATAGDVEKAARPFRRPRFSVPAAMALVGVVAVTVATGWLWWSEQWSLAHDRAVAAITDEHAADGLADARAAATNDPSMTPYWLTFGLAAAETGDWQQAADAFQIVAERDDLPVAWIDLADARANLAESAEAAEAIDQGLRLGRQQPGLVIAAAGLRARIGDAAGTAALATEAIASAPSLVRSDWFQSLPSSTKQTAIQTARDRLADSFGEVDLDLATGDPDSASRVAVTLSSAYPWAADWVAAWSGDTRAAASMWRAADASPFDLNVLTAAARLADHLGDRVRADDLRTRAELVNGTSSITGYDWGVELDRVGNRTQPGINGQFYGHYTYRRPTPWDALPSDVLHVVLVR
jgi:O-antigen ligase